MVREDVTDKVTLSKDLKKVRKRAMYQFGGKHFRQKEQCVQLPEARAGTARRIGR